MEGGISKKQSSILYGIAILFMLYHHLFCIPKRLNTEYISLWNVIFEGRQIEQALSWFCKICVGIYAFISGYGMSKIFSKKFSSFLSLRSYFKNSYMTAIKYILRFMKKFWIVFVIFIPIGFGIGALTNFNVKEMLLCFFGLQMKYNNEWWYVTQYIYMLLLLPVLHLLVESIVNKDARHIKFFVAEGMLIGICVCVFLILKMKSRVSPNYVWIFIAGYLCARFCVFEYCNKFLSNKLKYFISIIILIVCFLIRTIVADSAAYSKCDVVIVPLFVFAVYLATQKENRVTDIFAWFGKYSVYMWLTHTFYCYYYFQNLITFSKFSTLMYFTLIVVSLITAIILCWIERLLDTLVSVWLPLFLHHK